MKREREREGGLVKRRLMSSQKPNERDNENHDKNNTHTQGHSESCA